VIQRIAEVGQYARIELFSREQQLMESAKLGYGRLGKTLRNGYSSGDSHFTPAAPRIVSEIAPGTAIPCRISQEQHR
jgi:hypothetical protein